MNSEKDFYTIDAMSRYGGSFVKVLAQLAARADHINLHKIKTTWPEYWAEYEKLGNKLPKENEI